MKPPPLPREEVSVGNWMLYQLLFAIPGVGLIASIVLAVSEGAHPAVKNFARAQLIWVGVLMVLAAGAGLMVVSFAFLAAMNAKKSTGLPWEPVSRAELPAYRVYSVTKEGERLVASLVVDASLSDEQLLEITRAQIEEHHPVAAAVLFFHSGIDKVNENFDVAGVWWGPPEREGEERQIYDYASYEFELRRPE